MLTVHVAHFPVSCSRLSKAPVTLLFSVCVRLFLEFLAQFTRPHINLLSMNFCRRQIFCCWRQNRSLQAHFDWADYGIHKGQMYTCCQCEFGFRSNFFLKKIDFYFLSSENTVNLYL